MIYMNYLRITQEVNETSKDLSIRTGIYIAIFSRFFSKKFPCPFSSLTFSCICENAGKWLFVKKVVKVLDIHTIFNHRCFVFGTGKLGELGITN